MKQQINYWSNSIVVSCQRYVTGPNLNGAPCPVDGRGGGSERLKGSSVERLKFVSNICFSINNFFDSVYGRWLRPSGKMIHSQSHGCAFGSPLG